MRAWLRAVDAGDMGGAGLAALLLAHIIVWTSFAVLAHPGSLHHDMTEGWAWGQEFELGYVKQPPFFSWIAGVWFHIFPRQDWAFYLLSSLNAAIGLAGAWCLAGQLLDAKERMEIGRAHV